MQPRALMLLLLALLTLSAAASVPPPEKSAPVRDLQWPGRIPAGDARGFDVHAYHLELDLAALPPQTPRIAGRTTIDLALLAEPPAELRLDLVDQLAVSSVLRDGAPAAWTQAGDSLRVALPDPPVPGAAHTIVVEYAGRPPRHGPLWAGLLLRDHGDWTPDDPSDDGPSVGNVSQPYSSHSWFPCKDHPADKATLRFDITAPDTLTVIATGVLQDTTTLPDGRRLWRWATDHPVATYLVGLAASNFASWEETCPCAEGPLPLQYHVFPEHRTEAEAVFAPTCAMMQFLEDLVGPYPFSGEKYAQAEITWGGAMENQTVTAFGQASLLLPTRSARLVNVHEMAHHWFGDSLTPRVWADIWLNEGFARYTEALWLEHDEGPAAYLAHLDLLRDEDLFQGDGLLADPDPVLPNLLVYDKGAWVLHMLRCHLGDPAFFAFLHDYATDPELRHASTDRAAMTAAATAASGLDVAAFLAPWLDTEAVPELGVRWRPANGGTLVEVTQHQDGPFFPLTVPVRVHAGAERRDLRLRMDSILAGALVATTAAVDSVVLDPDGWLLFRTADSPPPRLLAAQPRPNPAVGTVHLAYWLAAADAVSAAVYDVRGRLVRRVDLGVQPGLGPDDPLLWTWDGHDDRGRRAAAGVYWLELRTRDDRTVRKVTLLH